MPIQDRGNTNRLSAASGVTLIREKAASDGRYRQSVPFKNWTTGVSRQKSAVVQPDPMSVCRMNVHGTGWIDHLNPARITDRSETIRIRLKIVGVHIAKPEISVIAAETAIENEIGPV